MEGLNLEITSNHSLESDVFKINCDDYDEMDDFLFEGQT